MESRSGCLKLIAVVGPKHLWHVAGSVGVHFDVLAHVEQHKNRFEALQMLDEPEPFILTKDEPVKVKSNSKADAGRTDMQPVNENGFKIGGPEVSKSSEVR